MYIRDLTTRQLKRSGRLIIKDGAGAGRLLRWMADQPQEHMVVILLDCNCHVIGVETVYIGTKRDVHSEPANIFRPAILHHADYIIIAHNHPSGNLTPSASDMRHHRLFNRLGKDLDITVLANIIVAKNSYCSIGQYLAQIKSRVKQPTRRHGKQ